MGRHSSGSSGPYMRSVLGWAFPWILMASAVIVAVWFLVTTVGGRDIALEGERPSRGASTSSPDPSPSEQETPTPKPTRTRADPTPSPTRTRNEDPGGLITEGVTVQVVNGTGGVEGAASAMANQLASLGYRVEAIVTGLTIEQTIVYWSTDAGRPAAVALAEHFGWPSASAPPSLTPTVDVHVVVATDAI